MLCCGCVDWYVGKILKASMAFDANVWIHRYVDDIMAQVVVFCRAGQRKDASDYGQKLLDDLLAPYGEHFALTDENADEFIGLKIIGTDKDMFIEPISYVSIGAGGGCRRIRFQHLSSNGTMASKIAVL